MTSTYVHPTRLELELAEVTAHLVYDGESNRAVASNTKLIANALAQHRARTIAAIEASHDALKPGEPQPDAPKLVSALPDYWDERRRRQGKPDLSRCAAELRIALSRRPL